MRVVQPRVYYNDADPFCCQWLSELIKAGLIPDGDVDGRPIQEVQYDDVRDYTRCHFFAGISGWELALRLARFDPARPVWTGSCPCPPFSQAGKKKACPACGGHPVPCPRRTGYFICVECEHAWFADARHLWPEFWRLIRDVRPELVIGEQVAGNDGLVWLAGVRGSLERIGYAVGAGDIPACAVGAPHIRHRLYWVANTKRPGLRLSGPGTTEGATKGMQGANGEWQRLRTDAGTGGETIANGYRVAHPGGMGDSNGQSGTERDIGTETGFATPLGSDAARPSAISERLGYSICQGPQGRRASVRGGSIDGSGGESPGEPGDSRGVGNTESERERSGIDSEKGNGGGGIGVAGARQGSNGFDAGQTGGFWDHYDLISCSDGTVRRIPGRPQSGFQHMADGIPADLATLWLEGDRVHPLAKTFPGRTGLLKGSGNAIVPEVAAVFIRAYLLAEKDLKEPPHA